MTVRLGSYYCAKQSNRLDTREGGWGGRGRVCQVEGQSWRGGGDRKGREKYSGNWDSSGREGRRNEEESSTE